VQKVVGPTLVEIVQELVSRGMSISDIAKTSGLSEKETRKVAKKGTKLPLNRQRDAIKPLRKIWQESQGKPLKVA